MDTSQAQAARIIELERAQIGHEIHDALLPLILAASATVDSLRRRVSAEQPGTALGTDVLQRLEEASELLDRAMQTGRTLLSEVYPPELDQCDWVEAARQTIERLLGGDNNDVRAASKIKWVVQPAAATIPPALAMTCYRITVEAVRNAIRHGSANQVTVRMSSVDGHWQLVIADDGIGFDPDEVPADRFGLRALRARAQMACGALTVESQPGGPTRIRATLPDGLSIES